MRTILKYPHASAHRPGTTLLYQLVEQHYGKQSAGSASLQAAGVVAPLTREDDPDYTVSARSFIHGDTVYFVRGNEVWSTSWFAPSQVQGPF